MSNFEYRNNICAGGVSTLGGEFSKSKRSKRNKVFCFENLNFSAGGGSVLWRRKFEFVSDFELRISRLI